MVNIREAQLSDLQDLTNIYNWAVLNTTATFDLVEQTLEQRKTWFDQHKGNHPLIVTEYNGGVIGYSCLSTFREKQAYSKTSELSVYIHPAFHNKSIGTQLLEEIIKRGRQLGYHNIIAGITSDNEISIHMHEKAGFKKCGCFKEVGFKFERWLDVVFYELLLEVV